MKDEGIVGLQQQQQSGGNSNNHNGNGTNGSLNGQGALHHPSTLSHCTGCRELKREVDDLRRLISHFLEPRSTVAAADPQAQTQQPTARIQPEIARIQQQPQQPQAEMPSQLQHLTPQLAWLLNSAGGGGGGATAAAGLTPSSPTNNTLKLLEGLEAVRNANATSATSSLSAFWSTLQANAAASVPTSSSAVTTANNSVVEQMNNAAAAALSGVQGHEHSFVGGHQVPMESSDTSSSPSSTNTQLMLISPQQQQQLRNATFLNGNARQVLDSVVSQLNTNTMSQLLNLTQTAAANTPPQTPLQQQIAAILRAQQIQLQNQQQNAELPAQLHQQSMLLNNAIQQQNREREQQEREQKFRQEQQVQMLQAQQQQRQRELQAQQQVMANLQAASGGRSTAGLSSTVPTPTGERIPAERRMHSGFQRAASDDYVRIIRHQDLSEENVRKIQIPVPEAMQIDPSFRPLGEQQVIQQVMQNKKYESVNVAETMAQLCKKLAEKRVFGSRLMAQTTVAAPNHSNYNNLPNDGIIYIQHVCRKVLGGRVESDEEFWECFREAMRKLAARCRRVRHAKKVRSPPKVEDLLMQQHRASQLHPHQLNPSAFLLAASNKQASQPQQELLPRFSGGSVAGVGASQQQQANVSAALDLLRMEVDPSPLVAELQQQQAMHGPPASPPESQAFSSPSRNSSTPTPSSSSKPDN